MNTQDGLQNTMIETTKTAPELTPEQQAQIEATAQQLATSTPIPGITTEMLDKGGELLNAGMETLGAVADVAGLAVTAVEVVASVAGAVADLVGNIDLGGS